MASRPHLNKAEIATLANAVMDRPKAKAEQAEQNVQTTLPASPTVDEVATPQFAARLTEGFAKAATSAVERQRIIDHTLPPEVTDRFAALRSGP